MVQAPRASLPRTMDWQSLDRFINVRYRSLLEDTNYPLSTLIVSSDAST